MKNLLTGLVILTALLPVAFYYELPEMGACLIVGMAFCLVGIENVFNAKKS